MVVLFLQRFCGSYGKYCFEEAMQNSVEKIINKSEFVDKLSSQCPDIPEKTVEEASKKIIEMMIHTLCGDGRIEVRGFGSFSLHHREARTARNPKTGEKVTVSAKAIPYFKPGKALKEGVNENFTE